MKAVLALALLAAAAAASPVNPTCPGVLILGVYKKNDAAGVATKVVEDKIGVPSKLNWAYVAKSSFVCSDGRWNQPALYTPGGDLGEFILAVSSYEKMTQTKMTFAQVRDLMGKFITKSQRSAFGMCSSTAAAEAAERIAGNFSADGIESAAGSLMSDVADPFLKQLLTSPDKYKTSLTTTKNCIKAFYAIKFNATGAAAAKAKVYTLTGSSDAKAIVNVKTAKRCTAAGLGPLLKAAPQGTDGVQVVYNSEDAVKVYRNELANFFTEETSQVDADDMRSKMTETGNVQLTQFALSMGSLPAFQADIK
jgi:hypothetical protein